MNSGRRWPCSGHTLLWRARVRATHRGAARRSQLLLLRVTATPSRAMREGELASTLHLGAVAVALIAAAVRVAVALVAVGIGARRLALGLLQASWRWRRRLARRCWRRRKEEGGRREPGGIRIGPAGDRAARRRDLRRAVVAVAVVTAAVRVSVCSVAVGVGAPRRAFGRRRRRGRWHCHRRWR